MGASNWKRVFIKVVALSKTFKMVTNLMSFGFEMIELCIFEDKSTLTKAQQQMRNSIKSIQMVNTIKMTFIQLKIVK